MNLDDAYPSKYMKASDLPDDGSALPFKIRDITTEEIGRDKDLKPVIYFDKQDKGFVCNKTNKNTIKKIFGSADSDDLVGKTILLYATEVQFGDEMVESIRVKLRAGSSKPTAKVEEDDSEIPFK